MKKNVTLLFFALLGISMTFAFAQNDAVDKDVSHFKLKDIKFKPYIDVLCTPEGRNVLRDSPSDHIHHHGLMFAIKVDGVNFWEEFDDTFGKQIVVGEPRFGIVTVVGGQPQGKIYSTKVDLDWVDGSQNVLLKEKRAVIVQAMEGKKTPRLLTWESQFFVPEGKEKAVLGGNHYHGLGMRFDASMDKGGEFFIGDPGTAEKVGGGDETLTPCKWMAYTADLEGKPVTVALFDSPKNPRQMLAFTMGNGSAFAYLSATVNLYREPLELDQGQAVTFCYGVAVWEGKQTSEDVNITYRKWLVDKLPQPLKEFSNEQK